MKNADSGDLNWTEFEKTGSIRSYLKYKGISCADGFDEKIDTNIKDGEPSGAD